MFRDIWVCASQDILELLQHTSIELKRKLKMLLFIASDDSEEKYVNNKHRVFIVFGKCIL